MALSYMQLLIPGVWMECLARSLNRILVAQRIARPQMGVALMVVPLHVATNYLLIHKLK
ncbi:multidrug and toxin extrusion protein 1, partial [Haematococcus lacustris]